MTGRDVGMNDETMAGESARERTIRELHELVAALDRRVPQVQRVGEAEIAQAGANLRARALRRIEELEQAAAGPNAG
jgi:hypothetical protein